MVSKGRGKFSHLSPCPKRESSFQANSQKECFGVYGRIVDKSGHGALNMAWKLWDEVENIEALGMKHETDQTLKVWFVTEPKIKKCMIIVVLIRF